MYPPGTLDKAPDVSNEVNAPSTTLNSSPPPPPTPPAQPAVGESPKEVGIADTRLPPAPDTTSEQTPGKQVALPTTKHAATEPATPPASVAIRDADGAIVTLVEPKKVIGSGERQKELRTLSPQQKARVRFVKNFLVWFFCAIVLAIALVLLARFNG